MQHECYIAPFDISVSESEINKFTVMTLLWRGMMWRTSSSLEVWTQFINDECPPPSPVIFYCHCCCFCFIYTCSSFNIFVIFVLVGVKSGGLQKQRTMHQVTTLWQFLLFQSIIEKFSITFQCGRITNVQWFFHQTQMRKHACYWQNNPYV